MSEPRGSAAFFNGIFRDAMERGAQLIKDALAPLAESGHPPLTQKITLADLKKMPPEKVNELLQVELRRTMQKGEMGEPIPDPETLKLIADYKTWQRQGVTNGDGTDYA